MHTCMLGYYIPEGTIHTVCLVGPGGNTKRARLGIDSGQILLAVPGDVVTVLSDWEQPGIQSLSACSTGSVPKDSQAVPDADTTVR
jgi:hypothetical protein